MKGIGIDETIEYLKWVKEQIKDGAKEEDSGNIFTSSFYNHYHNPRLTWDKAGLNTIYPFINGKSSLLWAQDDSNEWSWQKAREYYYLALTSSTDTVRSENFAKTFKGVGHIIHLIQDVAQPAHVRNDPHPLDGMGVIPGFESWAENPDNQYYISSFISNPIFPVVPLNVSVGGYAPITQFWDINQYDGTNPPSGIAIGISEYTNANFFSEDTISADNFPYPRITADIPVVERNFTNELWNETYPRQYYLKNCCGETKGGEGYLLSAVDYLDYYRQQYPLLSAGLPKIPVLDDNVYKDYASLLIPRAVGYSAGLINYFFRGEIDMVEDPNNPGQYIIKNDSAEPISGTFSVYYDDVDGNRYLADSWSLSINAGAGSDPVPFEEPTSPTPAEKGKYILVFNGALGSEERAVIGKVVPLETTEELILYAAGSEYKTYNPKTKEVKPYNGLLKGATGRVIWREDGKAALSVQGSSWYLVNLDKNTKSAIMGHSDYRYETGGWRGDTAVMSKVQYYSSGYYKLYFTEIPPDSSANNYLINIPNAIGPINIDVSWDGKKMTFGGSRRVSDREFDYYLVDFDTISKSLAIEKVGEARTYQHTDTITNSPFLIAYHDSNLRVLYANGSLTRSTQKVGGCTVDNSNRVTMYDKLGEASGSYVRRYSCSDSFLEDTYDRIESLNPSHFDYSILKSGIDIIPYRLVEYSYYSVPASWQSTYRMTPYLHVGGTAIGGNVFELFQPPSVTIRVNRDDVVNLNSSKDRSIAALWVTITNYYTKELIYAEKIVYYISDNESREITGDNPDFQNATFFTFVKE